MGRSWRVEVLFGGRAIRTLTVTVPAGGEIEAIARGIAQCGLQPCRERNKAWRCPAGGGLHAHVPERLVRCQRRVDGEGHYCAYLPEIGDLSWVLPAGELASPPVTFRVTPPG